ncbi:hypothetical protein CP10139811_1634, partial [Chlamydia ibidis]
MGKGT